MNSLICAIEGWAVALIVLCCILAAGLVVLFVLVPIKTWFVALVSGAHVSMARLVGMKLRKVKYKLIVDSYIMARKGGINISIIDLETHYMAGGNVDNIIKALIAAHSAGIDLTIDLAKAIDLSGRDVVEAIETCVTPKIIEVKHIAAIAQDGIEVIINVNVTVKTDIRELVGGAGEDTIIARVGKGVVSCIGAAENYTQLLENPAAIGDEILRKGLDDGTAFDIVSVDVADIDIGKNLGARLEMDEAEKDRQIANAVAEKTRAAMVAEEQRYKAKTQEMKAAVLAAEAEIPKAIAGAIRDGKFGVLDYYKLKNLQADTAMRSSIAGIEQDSGDGEA